MLPLNFFRESHKSSISTVHVSSKPLLWQATRERHLRAPGFSLGRLQMEGNKALMGGGTREGGHRPYGGGGTNFARLYQKLKVLLLLSCNYMMQFIGYDSIKTR